MNEGHFLFRRIGRFDSSVDSKVDQARYVEEYMKKNHHPPFPETWQPLYQRGQSFETYIKALEYFYTMYNGMEILYVDVCKCIFSSPFPSELDFRDMEDQDYDSKAIKRGKECPFNIEQQEGMKNKDTDTVTGLLLQTMCDCYFKKRDVIEKVSEIHGINKRFSEFALKDFEEMEVSQEKRKNELSPLFDHCLDQLNEDGLKEVIKKLYIKTWKKHVEFDEKEFTHLQKMDDMTKKYFDAMKATEDKNKYLSSEVRKQKKRCVELENTKREQRERISKYKEDEEYLRKLNEQHQRKIKEVMAREKNLLQENKSFEQINLEIQRNRAEMQTTIYRLREYQKQLESTNKQALEREVQYKTEVQRLKSEISNMEKILRQLEDERASMKDEFSAIRSNIDSQLERFYATRLSEVMLYGRTDVTDLSNPNIPIKIGERFREIFDNEWTEALEELTTKHVGVSNRMAVDFLLNVMMMSYRMCSAHNRCFQSFEDTISDSGDQQGDDTNPPPKISLNSRMKKRIDDMRKRVHPEMKEVAKEVYFVNIDVQLSMLKRPCQERNVTEVQSLLADMGAVGEEVVTSSSDALLEVSNEYDDLNPGKQPDICKYKTRSSHEEKERGEVQVTNETGEAYLKTSYSQLYKYSKECYDLCLLMRNHSPALHLDGQVKKGSEFDPNRFRHYTQTGTKIEFVVWPALHLYEGGPLLAKGVAQPIKDTKQK